MRICDEKREYAMHADRSLRFDLQVADLQDMVTMPIFDGGCPTVISGGKIPIEFDAFDIIDKRQFCNGLVRLDAFLECRNGTSIAEENITMFVFLHC